MEIIEYEKTSKKDFPTQFALEKISREILDISRHFI